MMISKLLCCSILFLAITSQRSLKKWCYRGDLNSKQRFDCMCILKHFHAMFYLYTCYDAYKYVSYELRNRPRSPRSLCGSVAGRNLKVWGSIPHGDSQFFLCPTLVTRRKTSFFLNKYFASRHSFRAPFKIVKLANSWVFLNFEF